MILLDTHALLWVHTGHQRARPWRHMRGASACPQPVCWSSSCWWRPVASGCVTALDQWTLLADDRWLMDEPAAGGWFERALELGCTRDPFDRLLAAHALLRRWKLATADEVLLERMPAGSCLEL